MMRWLDFLFPPRPDEALVRDTTTDAFCALAAARRVGRTTPATVALLPFADARVRSAIHEAKYHGNERAFALLAATLAAHLRARANGTLVLVPIPLGRARRKERGYNQVEEVARRAVSGLDLSVDADLLVRTRETASQVDLPRAAREANMRGAFRAARPVSPGTIYIVLDDVITTGATLQAAADALREAGATRFELLALAH